MASYPQHLWPSIRLVFADGGRIQGHCSRLSIFSFLLSLSTSAAGGLLSSPQHALVAGSFARLPPPCTPLPVSPLPCPLWYGMVGTVAGDGAPRSLSLVRSSGVCWTRPFSFYDSSLVVPRPFLLSSFHPPNALCVVFVAECCLLRYWLGFYLNWQLLAMFHCHWLTGNLVTITTYAPGHFSPSPTGWAYLSQIQFFIVTLYKVCSIFQPMKQATPSPSDGWRACSRRSQLALDLTVRGTGYTYTPLHSPGDCIVVGVFCVFGFVIVAFKETGFQWICDSSLCLRWQKGDRPDNDLRWAMQHSDKKISMGCDIFFSENHQLKARVKDQ